MKLIVPTYIAARLDPQIARVAPGCQIVHLDSQGAPDGDLSDAEILVSWWLEDPEFLATLAAAPRLRWVHTPSAGVEHLLSLPEFLERDLLLTNSAGAHAAPIAEYVLLGMLGHVKRVRELLREQRGDAWNFWERAQLDELTGKTLLVIGLGSIGREIAQRAAPFGVRIIGSRRTPAPMPFVERVVGEHAWRELLPEADFIVLATPLTAATRGMFGAAELALVKQGAYLINVARGQIIDQAALLAALREGRLAGALLDVTDPEPAPADDPIWETPGAWVTPHISASSPRTVQRQIEMFVENLRRYLAGEQLHNLVSREDGY